jgi:spoIIIJ-associated protein
MIYEYIGKTEKEAVELAANELGLATDRFDVEILETQKTSLFKKGYVKIRVHTDGNETPGTSAVTEPNPRNPGSQELDSREPVPAQSRRRVADPLPQDDFERQLLDFITGIVKKMGYDASAEIMFRESKKLVIKLNSASSSILIGRKGKNLDALQLLLNVYADCLGRSEVRIILDTENYRIRREESLVRLAYTTADKVRSTKGSILLEPMNPFERRLIHFSLNDIGDIETKSEGEGLYKQVRVIFKGHY